jgi:hypothetical protein
MQWNFSHFTMYTHEDFVLGNKYKNLCKGREEEFSK